MRKIAAAVLLLPSIAFAANSFDGSGDGYTVNNINKPSANYSVCGWVKPSTSAADNTMFSYGQGVDSSTARGWDAVQRSSGRLRRNHWYGTFAINTETSTGALTDGVWQHVCVTSASGTNKVYVNGTEIHSGSLGSQDAQQATDDFIVALRTPLTSGYGYTDWPGEMAQVAYWDATLSGAQVTSLADKSTCPTSISPAPQVFLKMDAVPAVDTSTNAFSVTQSGTPTLTSDPSGLPCAAPTPTPTPTPSPSAAACNRKGQVDNVCKPGQL